MPLPGTIGRVADRAFGRYADAAGVGHADLPAIRMLTWMIHLPSEAGRADEDRADEPDGGDDASDDSPRIHRGPVLRCLSPPLGARRARRAGGALMRVLVVTDGFPYPLTSGRLREHQFLRELSIRHEVVLLSAVQPSQPREHLAAVRPWVSHVEMVETPRLAHGLRRKVRARVATIVLSGLGHPMRALLDQVTDLHAFEPFDVVLNAHLDAPLHEAVPDVPVVVDLCDAMAAAAAGRLRHAPLREIPGSAVRYLEARRRQARLIAEADHLLLASERDVRRVFPRGAPPTTPLSVLPNGVDLDHWQRTTRRLGDLVVMTGAMPYAPNHDAALRLVETIMPLVRARRPTARLAIVGRDPRPSLLRATEGLPWVEVTGEVDDLRPWLESAAVFAAPLRFGAGIQNKVLEAMAMEVPVIASPLAEAGLVVDGRHPPITVASTQRQFGDAIVARLGAVASEPTPDAAARAWVAARFDWPTIGARLEAILLGAAGRPSPVSSGEGAGIDAAASPPPG